MFRKGEIRQWAKKIEEQQNKSQEDTLSDSSDTDDEELENVIIRKGCNGQKKDISLYSTNSKRH